MKQFLFLAVLVTAFSQLSSAAACTSGSLASYETLGAGGCTIGADTLYDFQTLSGTAGATAIAATGITITPIGGTFDPGITAVANVSAAAGGLQESIFTYRIAGNSFVSSSITLGGSSETMDGAVTDVQNFCAGGVFGSDGLSGCTGTPGSLLTLDGTQNQDSVAFSPTGSLSVTDDLILDGGLAGSASGGTFTDQFTATPEPSTFFLTGLVFALAAALKVRRSGSVHSDGREEQL